MKSGKTVRANARHPFLVSERGREVWRRTDTLKKGEKILTVIGENGEISSAAQAGATSPLSAKACACRTTISSDGQKALGRLRSILSHGARRICGIVTGLAWKNTTESLKSRAEFALFVSSRRAKKTPERTGMESCASITAMTAKRLEDCSATTATLQLDTAKQQRFCGQPLTTLSVIPDEIVEIVEGGFEDVFDIQVERTENFIANGLVSHNTRWHEDDLAGRLLEREGDQWDVLDLPAISEAGEALWPEWYPIEALERIKATVGPREWSALYQQKPQPDEGTFFKREWFPSWDKLPTLQYYGTSDYAVTDGGGDYTVHRIWGICPQGMIYRVDGWRGQTTSDVWIEEKLNLIAKYKPLAWFGEGGVIQKAIEPMLKRRMQERRIFCRLEWLSSVSDKPTRARSFQAMAASGRVKFEPNADISEFLVFPAGKNDDDVDTASLIGRAIDQAHPAIVRTETNQAGWDGPHRPAWRRKQGGGDSWKTL